MVNTLAGKNTFAKQVFVGKNQTPCQLFFDKNQTPCKVFVGKNRRNFAILMSNFFFNNFFFDPKGPRARVLQLGMGNILYLRFLANNC